MRIRHYSLTKLFLKRFCWAIPLVSAVCFFCLLNLPITNLLFEQYATAAMQGDKTLTDTNGADFSQSVMLGPAHKIREGDTIDYEIILRNTGSKRPDYIELRNPVEQPSALLASAPELSYDLTKRELYWRGTVDPGEERRFALRLVTLPKSAGTFVSNHASIVWGTWVTKSGSFWDIKRKDIQCDPLEVRSQEKNTRVLFTIAGIELGWLEVLILGYFGFAPLFLIVAPRLVRWRERKLFERSPNVSWRDQDRGGFMVYAMSIAFLVCLSAVLFFVSFIFEDIRKFSAYEKTICTILDKKLSWSTGSRGKTKSRTYDPLVSVRYEAKGKGVLSAGSMINGTFLGRESSAKKTLAQYELGKSYPCWFDPEDPQQFVIQRGLFWGWYLLFLGPLIFFGIATRYLLVRLRGPHTAREMSNGPIQPG